MSRRKRPVVPFHALRTAIAEINLAHYAIRCAGSAKPQHRRGHLGDAHGHVERVREILRDLLAAEWAAGD